MAEHDPYTLRILRLELPSGKVTEELIDGETTRKYVGGTGLATKYLWEEVPAGVDWSDPENRITFFTGPLAGTRVCGSGTFSVTTKGACTNMCGTSQANGFLGAFMRQNGIDGIIVQGAADRWVRLHIEDGGLQVLDAEDLLGLDTWETEEAVKKQIEHQVQRLQHRPGWREWRPVRGHRRRPWPRGRAQWRRRGDGVQEDQGHLRREG